MINILIRSYHDDFLSINTNSKFSIHLICEKNIKYLNRIGMPSFAHIMRMVWGTMKLSSQNKYHCY